MNELDKASPLGAVHRTEPKLPRVHASTSLHQARLSPPRVDRRPINTFASEERIVENESQKEVAEVLQQIRSVVL